MIQCPRCDFENADTNQYCDNCGTVLQKIAAYPPPSYTQTHAQIEPGADSMEPMEYEILPPPPPLEYDGPRPFGQEMMTAPLLFANQKIVEAPRITIFRVIRAIFYFMAAMVTGFGLFAAFISFDDSSRNQGLGLFFWLGLLLASTVIFIRVQRRTQRLRLLQWIGWICGATIGAFMALILDSALIPGGIVAPLGSFIFGCIIVVYSLVLAWIALW